jgi:hypothetical protein
LRKEGTAMNVPIRMLGIATLFFWIILIGFIASAAYSIKDLNIGFGEPQFAVASNHELLFSLPLHIDNKGYYSLKSFNITTVLSDAEGSEISSASAFVPTIPQGQNITIFHNVTLAVDSLLEKGGRYLFNDDNFTASVTAGLNFAELIPAKISTNMTYPWGAPFYNFMLGPPSYELLDSANSRVAVPLSFENHATFDLAGNMRIELYNSGNSLFGESQATFNVPQGSRYNGNLEFHMPLNTASLSAAQSGHFDVFFSTSFFEYGPLVVPYG